MRNDEMSKVFDIMFKENSLPGIRQKAEPLPIEEKKSSNLLENLKFLKKEFHGCASD